MAVEIRGSGYNSKVTLYDIHQGNGYFRKDTSTTHSQVKLLQSALTDLGYDTQGADGKYGNNTFSAVKKFQEANLLSTDGLFGKKSLTTLETILGDHLDKDNCETASGSAGTDTPTPTPAPEPTDSVFKSGIFGRTTTTQVRIRTKPSVSSDMKVVKGSMFLIEGTETGPTLSGSNLWVKIRFGKGDGSHVSRYIHSSCFGDTCNIVAKADWRIVALAQTLIGNTGKALGLSGGWCQKFIYWLFGACGIAVRDKTIPFEEGLCGQARQRMVERGIAEWYPRKEDYTPVAGDLIYYGPDDGNTSRHVGLVVIGGTNFKTVEGNMGPYTDDKQHLNQVKLCSGSSADKKCNSKSYQGFIHLDYAKF